MESQLTIEEKAKKIRLLILDVDGVLTNGVIYYGMENALLKGFHIHDGLGIKLAQKFGIQVAIISAKNSKAVRDRCLELGIQHVFVGQENKLPAYETLKTTLNLNDQEIAYVGDDLPDLRVLARVGLAISVANAPQVIKDQVDMVTINKGGKGAVREVCDFLLTMQGHFESMIQSYLD